MVAKTTIATIFVYFLFLFFFTLFSFFSSIYIILSTLFLFTPFPFPSHSLGFDKIVFHKGYLRPLVLRLRPLQPYVPLRTQLSASEPGWK